MLHKLSIGLWPKRFPSDAKGALKSGRDTAVFTDV